MSAITYLDPVNDIARVRMLPLRSESHVEIPENKRLSENFQHSGTEVPIYILCPSKYRKVYSVLFL